MTANPTETSGGWRRRLHSLATPETAIGCLIAVVWAVVASAPLLPPSIVIFIVLLTIGLHLTTVDSGSFSLLWITTGWVLLLIVVSTRSILGGADPLLFTAAGITALGHNELIRLAFARRRNARVDRSIYSSSAIGVGLAGLLAIIGIGLSDPIAQTVGRSWLWMPATIAIVVAVALGFVIVPTLGAPTAHKDRWQPGDRIPPRRQQQDR
ncbi:MAG: hypothetical protein ACR2QO_13600 [Acidimicrobiales bacterium]